MFLFDMELTCSAKKNDSQGKTENTRNRKEWTNKQSIYNWQKQSDSFRNVGKLYEAMNLHTSMYIFF